MFKIITIILMHAFGDFFMQGRRLSRLKALELPYLFVHTAIYTSVFIVFSPILLGLTFIEGLFYSLINGILHFMIDYATGHFKVKFLKKDESKYISTIGFDHTIHVLILILTYMYLYPEAIYKLTFWDKF